MQSRRAPTLFALAAAVAVVAACDVGHDYQRPALDLPQAYRATAATEAAAWPSTVWWQGFRSPELNALIQAARTRNFDIAAAIARVRQADAQVRIAGASLLPNIGGNAGASWQHEGINTGSTLVSNAGFDFHSYSTGLSASYELDFWGKNRAARQSAVASAMFSRFDQQTVALTVVTNVANTWFTALSLADRLAVARGNLADSEHTLAVIKGRFDAGTANQLDIAQQESLVAGVRATIPNFASQLDQQVIALGILTGQPPERIAVTPGTLTTLALPPVAPGLPSELLARRPDVALAEAQLVAQNFSITVARAAFFPSIQLTASAGYQAPALNRLVTPGGALASVAEGLTLPIFDGGTLRGQLDLAKGRYDELLADYRKAVVQAFTDVDTALTAWRYATEQERLQAVAVETARRAATIARAQMEAGTVDITTVLTAETTLFSAEDTLVQVRLARAQALLTLYKALGGGWTEPDRSVTDQFPGLAPGMVPGGMALPVGGNVK
ncbi:efflux transporter outer membrane subunit [Acidisphaera sp. S103]|uniref:efflux transporter outer membrane subunit n=1 Tax=Acidisphaera sp. S103 TaxID=1747223 RepID=UPI00131D0075|nr:efflux transporter outer membrane subunit [Acidisphaera sp. S103]